MHTEKRTVRLEGPLKDGTQFVSSPTEVAYRTARARRYLGAESEVGALTRSGFRAPPRRPLRVESLMIVEQDHDE